MKEEGVRPANHLQQRWYYQPVVKDQEKNKKAIGSNRQAAKNIFPIHAHG
jgi:hypothetical protein